MGGQGLALAGQVVQAAQAAKGLVFTEKFQVLGFSINLKFRRFFCKKGVEGCIFFAEMMVRNSAFATA